MITTYLKLHYLDKDSAVFIGDSEETIETQDFFGNEREHTNRYPAFQISREMWELYNRPTMIEIVVRDYTHVVVDD